MDANEHDDAMEDTQRQIARLLPDIIRGADLEKATVRTLQKSLENSLGRDLGEHKNFIRAEEFSSDFCSVRTVAKSRWRIRWDGIWANTKTLYAPRCELERARDREETPAR